MKDHHVSLSQHLESTFLCLDLGFDKWSLFEVLLASAISGFVVAALVQLFFVKRLRQSITKGDMEAVITDSPKNGIRTDVNGQF